MITRNCACTPNNQQQWITRFFLGDYLKSRRLIFCDSALKYSQLYYNVMQKESFSSFLDHCEYISYGYNYMHIGCAYYYGSTGYPHRPPAKINQIANLSKTILLAETRSNGNASGGNTLEGSSLLNPAPSVTLYTGVLRANHGKAINVLWADGHTESCVLDNSVNGYGTTPFKNGNSVGGAENYWDRK